MMTTECEIEHKYIVDYTELQHWLHDKHNTLVSVLVLEQCYVDDVVLDGNALYVKIDSQQLPVLLGHVNDRLQTCVMSELTVRVRTDSVTKTAWLTIKTPRVGIKCEEYEYVIDYDTARLIMQNANPLCIISKVRMVIKDKHDQQWDLDMFIGRHYGLILAELEVDDEDQEVIVPACMIQDVSMDYKYTNKYMAFH